MQVYTVHEPPSPPADHSARAEELVFVPDGFDWSAAILGPFWLATQRLWTELAAWGGAAVLIAGVFWLTGAGSGWTALALAALNVVIGYEAGDLERDRLTAAGWTDLGSATGKSAAEAERDFFDRWLPGAAEPSAARHA